MICGILMNMERLAHWGAGTADIGLVGLPLSSLLFAHFQKDKRNSVTLLNVLRRGSRHHRP
jgi:hypothetical protein